MRTVDSSQLEPGMILARPIVLKNGMILFGEGTELTEDYIERIRAMATPGVIQIVGRTVSAESLEQQLEKLDARFHFVERQPHMKLLKRLVEEHLRETTSEP